MESYKILIVDDSETMAMSLATLLQDQGYTTLVALSGDEALKIVKDQENISLALVDLVMPLLDGITLTERIKEIRPDMYVFIVTGYGSIRTAVEAIKQGAHDYLEKPVDTNTLMEKIEQAVEMYKLKKKVSKYWDPAEKKIEFNDIVIESKRMQEVLNKVHAASRSDVPVLIVGETGTGKEIFARTIHRNSRRATKPFIPVNCGALPKDLVESELFGYKKGAFTGALRNYKGLFVAASEGTLFLDEIGEMPKEAQVKLLRVLQDGKVRAIGDTRDVEVDVRIIAASNRPLNDLKGQWLREDIYYRIATLTITIPPLRERRENIPLLINQFLRKYGKKYARKLKLEEKALRLLMDYPFYGNVRELEHIIEGILAMADEDKQRITASDVKAMLGTHNPDVGVNKDREALIYDASTISMEQFEQFAINQALRLAKGNKARAAEILSISRKSLYRKLKQYHITA